MNKRSDIRDEQWREIEASLGARLDGGKQCPPALDFFRLAHEETAGVPDAAAQAKILRDHAQQCVYCGHLYRGALEGAADIAAGVTALPQFEPGLFGVAGEKGERELSALALFADVADVPEENSIVREEASLQNANPPLASTHNRMKEATAPWWRPHAVATLVTMAFLLIPPSVVLLAAYLFSDYGLGLSGWANSVSKLILISTLIITIVLAVSWLCARRYGWMQRPFLAGVASLLTVTIGCEVALSNYTQREAIWREKMIQSHDWISYDSAYYWPKDLEKLTSRPAQEPNEAQIRRELTVLRNAGFTGLFIHECRVGQIGVPRIAQEVGFSAIVQGIRVADPKNLDEFETQQQISNALSVSKFVDAYVFGELNFREVSFAALKKQLARLRWLTGKPVTTSFLHNDDSARLRELKDFTVRALARPWTGNAGDPEEAIKAVKKSLDTFLQDDMPSLLTTVFYPSDGGQGFSEENQYRFFRGVRALKPPRGVNLVFFSSFDRPWARKLSHVTTYTPRFEGYTGLFAAELTGSDEVKIWPRKALEVFGSRKNSR